MPDELLFTPGRRGRAATRPAGRATKHSTTGPCRDPAFVRKRRLMGACAGRAVLVDGQTKVAGGAVVGPLLAAPGAERAVVMARGWARVSVTRLHVASDIGLILVAKDGTRSSSAVRRCR